MNFSLSENLSFIFRTFYFSFQKNNVAILYKITETLNIFNFYFSKHSFIEKMLRNKVLNLPKSIGREKLLKIINRGLLGPACEPTFLLGPAWEPTSPQRPKQLALALAPLLASDSALSGPA